MGCSGVTFIFKSWKQHFLRKKHNPSSYNCMIWSLEHRLLTAVTLVSCTDLRNQAQPNTPQPPSPKQTSVMQTSSHLGTVWQWCSTVLGPTRLNCDLQIQITNRMNWKQTRPSCNTYDPSAPMNKMFILHLVSRLRMGGATPLLPIHAFRLDTETLHMAVQLSNSA